MRTSRSLASLTLGAGVTLALLWLLGSITRADPATLYVAPTGFDGPDCSQPGQPCRTVQHAVDQATDGDTIKIAAGTYTATTSSVVSITKSISLTGGYGPPDWTTSDPDGNPTVLDGQEQRRVVAIAQGYTVTLESLQITNGATDDRGGGVFAALENPDAPRVLLTIRNCAFLHNTSGGPGGGVWAYNALLLENSRVVSNTAGGEGGGVLATAATMTHNLFQHNVSCKGWSACWGGGGAYIISNDDESYVAHNTFEGNTAMTSTTSSPDGGGLYITGMQEPLVVTGNVFRNNVAGDRGGGLYISGSHRTCTVTHNLIQNNIASLDDHGDGGGVYAFCSQGWTVFSHNQVLDNVATTGKLKEGRGGGVLIWGPALISDNVIQSNWGATVWQSKGWGGGIYLKGDACLVQGNRILDNRATEFPGGFSPNAYGGGVYVSSGRVTMTNNIVAGNCYSDNCGDSSRLHTGGGGIYVSGAAQFKPDWLYLAHNTIADNQSPAIENGATVVTMTHNILSGHPIDLEATAESQFFTPTITADYTLWSPAMNIDQDGTIVTTHDFTGTPDFVSTPLDNYHLGPASQAIDKGPGTGVTTDIDSHSRPVGAGYDLGADEYLDVDLSPSTKAANPQEAGAGGTVTFTIVLCNGGNSDAPDTVLFDAIPTSTTYVPGSAKATSGAITDTNGVSWRGTVAPGEAVTITFQVTVNQAASIQNTAVVTDAYGAVHRLVALVNPQSIYLPLIVR